MMVSPRGNWGWLVLGLVLLVPVLGFVKWWLDIHAQQSGTSAMRMTPPTFPVSANPSQKPRPPYIAVSTATQKPAMTLAGATAGVAEPVSIPKAGKSDVVTSTVPAVSTPIPIRTPVPDASEGGYKPKTNRDPTLSPDDLVRLERMREAHEPRPQVKTGRNDSGIERRIMVNGIVATDTSINAIINGNRYSERALVSGTGVRIRKITQTCVEFEYKKRTFEKCIKK